MSVMTSEKRYTVQRSNLTEREYTVTEITWLCRTLELPPKALYLTEDGEWKPLQPFAEELVSAEERAIAAREQQAAPRAHAARVLPLAPRPDPPPCPRRVYILVGVFFGWLGVHNFLAGLYERGVAQFGLALGGWFFGYYFWIAGLFWALLDVCLVRKDCRGRLLP